MTIQTEIKDFSKRIKFLLKSFIFFFNLQTYNNVKTFKVKRQGV